MRDMGIVYGSREQAIPLIVGKDTVYEHSQIEQVLTDSEGNSVDNLFKFHEIQYDKDEYIAKVGLDNKHLQTLVADLGEEMLLGGVV